VDQDAISVNLERDDTQEILELNIVLPDQPTARLSP
jgi:septum formation topological specificity factor MinE